MSLIKGLFIFAAGMGTGAGVMYYIMKKQNPVVLERKEDPKEIMTRDELYDYYISGLEELGYGTAPMTGEEYEEYESRKSYVNPIDDDEDEEEIEEAPGPVEPNPNPYIITEKEFGQEDDYETVTLSYYKKDSVMTDDDNEILDNWKSHVCEFDTSKTSGDIDAIYIRNESEMTDYEILIYDGSYANLIMGEVDTEMGNMAD